MNAQPKRRVIGVDFDDVLLDFNDGLMRFHNEKYGVSFVLEDHVNVKLWEVWKCSKEESIDIVLKFYNDEMHHETNPVDGAVEAIAELSKQYSLVVVTSRPAYVKERTLEWLYKHFHKDFFADIHFTNQFAGKDKVRNKSQVCEELDVEIFIDDFVHNAEDIANAGRKVLLFDKPWNREAPEHPNIRRVHSWPEILEIVQSELA